MVTMIRTHTFLKYARLHLQEAESALQEEDIEKAAIRCSDVAMALLKALAASISQKKMDPESLDQKSLDRLLRDLADSPDRVRGLAEGLLELKAGPTVSGRAEAEALFSKTGQFFRAVHDLLCVS